MEDKLVRLGPREQQIADLLLEGCDNDEIARQLKMARRTVKAHFNRLFLRFGIRNGIKRVKLATLLYRRQLCSEASAMEPVFPTSENSESSNSSPKDSKTGKLPTPSEPLSTSLRTIFGSSMTSSDSGTGSSSRFGTKPGVMKAQSTPEPLEAWERTLLGLDRSMIPNGRILEH